MYKLIRKKDDLSLSSTVITLLINIFCFQLPWYLENAVQKLRYSQTNNISKLAGINNVEKSHQMPPQYKSNSTSNSRPGSYSGIPHHTWVTSHLLFITRAISVSTTELWPIATLRARVPRPGAPLSPALWRQTSHVHGQAHHPAEHDLQPPGRGQAHGPRWPGRSLLWRYIFLGHRRLCEFALWVHFCIFA